MKMKVLLKSGFRLWTILGAIHIEEYWNKERNKSVFSLISTGRLSPRIAVTKPDVAEERSEWARAVGGRKRRIVLGFTVFFTSCGPLNALLSPSLSAAESGLRVTVLAYNYSGVSQSVLAETATEVVRIYRPAEIEIAWVDLPAMPEVVGRLAEVRILPGPTRLAIRIVPKTMADRLPAEQNRFGFTIYPEDGGFAHFAYVFSDNAEQLANLRKTSYGVILGHLVAHELGHMLLGVGSHSAAGIMHVPWRYKELGTIQRGQMMFSSEQAQRMRMSVRARIALEETNGC